MKKSNPCLKHNLHSYPYLRQMIQAGTLQQMRVLRIETDKLILKSEQGQEAVLLKRELKEIPQLNDELEVFIFSDSNHERLATVKHPNLLLHEFGLLQVKEVNDKGAFLDWGIAKDLFVPFAEQKNKMQEGKWYLVFLYADEQNGRLLASAKLNKFLSNDQPELQARQEVDLMVMEKTDLGIKMIINNKYTGLVFYSDLIRPLRTGEKLKGYVHQLREDGKIDLRLRKPGAQEIRSSESILLESIKENDGFLPLHDKSDPDDIRDTLNMSKKTFKQAVGALYKRKIITLSDQGIHLVKE
ncbi:MAG: S1 RNA-binding domain-containing protein [Flavobacteriales bacterium]